MKFFIFRNSTIEPLFKEFDVKYSGYNDILNIEPEYDIYIWFYTQPLKADLKKVCDEISNYHVALEYILSQIKGKKSLFAFTLIEISTINYESIHNPVRKAINDFNKFLYEKANVSSNLKIIDLSTFTSIYGYEVLVDWKYYYLSMMVINPKLSREFSIWFNSQLDSIALRRKKCIALDLDNTIWGGIIGEDGIHGIKLDGTYPGNAFEDFQAELLELSKKGVLLTICSKNNEADVLAIWEKFPSMILRKQDFSAFRINWNDKAQNLEELSKELNLGLDSFVFIDDNPTERELIRGMFPMVGVPEFPEHPYELPKFFKHLVEKYFTVYKLTTEDLLRSQQYKENTQRVELQRSYSNFEDYIKDLKIEISVIQANDLNITRIAQLTQKTNQFNLTTKRYTNIDILNFLNLGSWVYCISVKDRFGDNGITGLIIIHFDKSTKMAIIDTFLQSCRILGKKIEDQFMTFMLEKLFLENDIFEISAKFIPTQKNDQVKDFYEKQGFLQSGQNQSGEKNYILRKYDFRRKSSDGYIIIEI